MKTKSKLIGMLLTATLIQALAPAAQAMTFATYSGAPQGNILMPSTSFAGRSVLVNFAQNYGASQSRVIMPSTSFAGRDLQANFAQNFGAQFTTMPYNENAGNFGGPPRKIGPNPYVVKTSSDGYTGGYHSVTTCASCQVEKQTKFDQSEKRKKDCTSACDKAGMK